MVCRNRAHKVMIQILTVSNQFFYEFDKASVFGLAIRPMPEARLVLGDQVDVVVPCEAFESFFPEIFAIHFICSCREDQEVDVEWCDGWNKCVQEARS